MGGCSGTLDERTSVSSTQAGETAGIDVAQADDMLIRSGERVFSSCASCHRVDKDGASSWYSYGTMIGPNLSGIFESEAGSKPNFQYSAALRNSGIVWSKETLGKYITNPTELVPDGDKTFALVLEKEDLEALLAFLKVSTEAD
jgi:cytochrome c